MRQEEQFLDIPQLMARHHLADETESITRRANMTREEMEKRDSDLCNAVEKLEEAITGLYEVIGDLEEGAESCAECGILAKGLKAHLEQMATTANRMHAEAQEIETELYEEGKQMNGWQVQAMWEADSARIWEDLNAPDPCEGKLMEAAGSLQVAISHLDKATDWVAQAASDLMGTPMEDVVGSFTQQMEDILAELKQLREKYGRGER